MISIDLGEEVEEHDHHQPPPPDSEEQEQAARKQHILENCSQPEGTQQERCENCAELGHHFDDCPHRNSSAEEEEEDEEEEGLNSGEDY